jgi:antitoxin component of RelBE/YafQ-DinJ toxin-antitoxin module
MNQNSKKSSGKQKAASSTGLVLNKKTLQAVKDADLKKKFKKFKTTKELFNDLGI